MPYDSTPFVRCIGKVSLNVSSGLLKWYKTLNRLIPSIFRLYLFALNNVLNSKAADQIKCVY